MYLDREWRNDTKEAISECLLGPYLYNLINKQEFLGLEGKCPSAAQDWEFTNSQSQEAQNLKGDEKEPTTN